MEVKGNRGNHRVLPLVAAILLLSHSVQAQELRPGGRVPVWREAAARFFATPNDSVANYVLDITFNTLFPDVNDSLIAEANRHLGTPYHYGGKGPKSFDCAGFARYVYAKFGYSLPGGAIPQSRLGRPVKERRKLQRGDLVFFQGRSGHGGVGHVGIVSEVDSVTGVFRFIHAATSTGVIYSYSTEEYYVTRYLCARRLLPDRQKPELPPPPKRKRR